MSHCRLRRNLAKIGVESSSLCIYCSEEEDTPIDFLISCGPMIHRRKKHFDSHCLAAGGLHTLKPFHLGSSRKLDRRSSLEIRNNTCP